MSIVNNHLRTGVAMFLVATSLMSFGRIYTNTKGNKISATFVKADDKTVTLKLTSNAKVYTLEKSTLSQKDQDYINRRQEAAAGDDSPKVVDNSKEKSFPPIIRQIGNCCSQQAGGYYILGHSLNQARGTSAALKENQIAAYHAWNFINQGIDRGSEFGDSWGIAKHMGLPSIADFGAQDQNAVGKWMSGYDKYYRAMKNRADEWTYLDVTTKSGLEDAKQWIHNRGKSKSEGGLLAVDFQMKDLKLATIAKSDPKGGMKIIKRWGRSGGGHLMTYVGYDDTVGYDFNGDGEITNNVDLNEDGKITPADYECGCFILANSWGKEWANKGFVYAPYREHAVSGWERGKWVGVLKVKNNYQPRVSLRLKMQCSNRSALQLSWTSASKRTSAKKLVFKDSPLFRRTALEEREQPKSPEKYVQYANQRYLMGSWPLRGPKDDAAIEMGFDLTDDFGELKNVIDQNIHLRFNLDEVGNKKISATVHEAELIFYSKSGRIEHRQDLLTKPRSVQQKLELSRQIKAR